MYSYRCRYIYKYLCSFILTYIITYIHAYIHTYSTEFKVTDPTNKLLTRWFQWNWAATPSPLPLGRGSKYKLRDTRSSEWTKDESGTWCFTIGVLGKIENLFLKPIFSEQIWWLVSEFFGGVEQGSLWKAGLLPLWQRREGGKSVGGRHA